MCSTHWMTLIYAKKENSYLTNVKTNDSFGNFDWQNILSNLNKLNNNHLSMIYLIHYHIRPLASFYSIWYKSQHIILLYIWQHEWSKEELNALWKTNINYKYSTCSVYM